MEISCFRLVFHVDGGFSSTSPLGHNRTSFSFLGQKVSLPVLFSFFSTTSLLSFVAVWYRRSSFLCSIASRALFPSVLFLCPCYFMPPEHLPLDRKDFFYEKKNDRAETLAPSAARWTDSHRGSADDLCRPPGALSQFLLDSPIPCRLI